MILYTFSGTAVLLGLGGTCLLIVAGIFLLRRRMGSATAKPANPFGYTPTTYRVSLCVALLGSFLTMNWTQYRDATVYTGSPIETDEIIEQVPITYHKPPPPPPLPPPVVIEPVPELDEPAPENVDQSITEDDFVVPVELPAPPVRKVAPPPPPPPTPEPDSTVAIFADRMPVFGADCKQLAGEARKRCSDRALLTFVQSGVTYPSLARNNGIEGTVVVTFVVEKDGSISGIEPVRELGGGCTEAALKAIRRINTEGMRFTPGVQAGRPVRVGFNLPVKFQLNR